VAQGRNRRRDEEKIKSLTLPGIEPGRRVCSVVITLTVLSRLWK